MKYINIDNLKVIACHGVLAEEKINTQPFYFDAQIQYDFEEAAANDDVNLTLNYDSIMRDISDFCQSNSFDLIETLCQRTARMLMRKYPIQSLTLAVKKPQAPVSLPFDCVSVTTTLTKKIVLLSLGSSMGDKSEYLNFAINRLKESKDITFLKASAQFENSPYGGVAKRSFTNMAVKISTHLSPYELLDYIHKTEELADRDRSIHWGDRTLDIDIIFFGDTIVDDERLVIPHPDYANRDFVLRPLCEIAPNFICPISKKRISQLEAECPKRL